ncbi:TPA: aminotransferase class I/II-fold pyridoxal phosphate-dependent enzyme [Streptococcus suis]
MTRFNPLIQSIAVSDIRQFDSEVSTIPDIIKLTLGEPDFNTPDHIKAAAIRAIQDNQSHYTPNAGLGLLRQATADYYREKFDLDYQADQVVTTVGATEAIQATIQTLFEPGDVLLVPTPVFPIYMPDALINHGQIVTIDTSADHFVLTPEKLRQTIADHADKTIKALVLVYPSNPTGVTYSKEQLTALSQVIKEAGLWVICDEIYAELTYDQQHFSLAKLLPDQAVVITGLSKSHAMTGWRIGYIMGPQPFIEQVVKSHQYMVTSPATISQYAALAAMTAGQGDAAIMRQAYKERRDFLKAALEACGFEVAPADGAFYLFAKIPASCPQDAWTFVRDLTQKAKVALIPGDSFGPGGQSYVRLSYAAAMADLEEAARRIQAYVASQGKA